VFRLLTYRKRIYQLIRISWNRGFFIVFTTNYFAPALSKTIPVHDIIHISSKHILISLSN